MIRSGFASHDVDPLNYNIIITSQSSTSTEDNSKHVYNVKKTELNNLFVMTTHTHYNKMSLKKMILIACFCDLILDRSII